MGLTSDAVNLFQYAAENDFFDPETAVVVLNMSLRRVRTALGELSGRMLLRPATTDGTWRAVDPELAAVELTGEMEIDIRERQREVGRLREEVLQLQNAYGTARREREQPVEVVADGVAALIRADGVQRARKQLCRVHGGLDAGRGLVDHLPEDVAALERGVAVRVVVAEVLRADPRFRRWALVAAPLGAEIRSLSSVGRPCEIVDDDLAFLPLPDGAGETAVVRQCDVLAHLAETFDLLWTLGSEVDVDRPGDDDGPGRLPQSRTILRMLADGHTDETVARRMGLSLRTYRRHTATLMDRLGARSRFQAGVLAARRDLV